MSGGIRYLEFDSTYRNRLEYPLPGDFIVPTTCTNPTNALNAKNYVSAAYPEQSWYQVPFAGSDFTVAINKFARVPNGPRILGKNDVLVIPHMINGRTYSSLWPIDWSNGTREEYKPSYMGAGTVPGTGIKGTMFKSDSPGIGTRNFWKDLLIRSQNVVSPQNFSGGTTAIPQLNQLASVQAKKDGYLTGSNLLKFDRDPLEEKGGFPPAGSLGFPYYYQRVIFTETPAVPPALLPILAERVGLDPGVVAALYGNTAYIRLGDETDPIAPKQYPPYLENVDDYKILPGDVLEIGGVDYTVGRAEEVFPAYFYVGELEVSTIISYEQLTGFVELASEYSSLKVGGDPKDFWLVDFDTNPQGLELYGGSPRLFFPLGSDVPNYYAGRELTNITAEVRSIKFDEPNITCVSYNENRRLLYLNEEFTRIDPDLFGLDLNASPLTDNVLLFLEDKIPFEIPAGSLLPIKSKGLTLTVAETSKKGSRAILIGMTIPNPGPITIFEIEEGTEIDRVVPTPWAEPNIAHKWENEDKLVIKGFSLITSYGQVSVSSQGEPSQGRFNSYIGGYFPRPSAISYPLPQGQTFGIYNNGVFSLDIISPGMGYTPTAPGRPVMAIIKKPKSWVPPFKDMVPLPHRSKDGVYTLMNICFVNVVSTDSKGGILDLSISSPGSDYEAGSMLSIISGEGDGTWKEGLGSGALVRVTATLQWISPNNTYSVDETTRSVRIAPQSIPKPGDAVYMPTFGWGQDRKHRDEYNSAPDIGYFEIDYGQVPTGENTADIVLSGLPRTLDPTGKIKETGSRIIQCVLESTNSQVLVPAKDTFQLAAPASYLMGGGKGNLVLGLQRAFPTNSFRGEYSLSGDVYIARSSGYTEWPESSKEFTDHRLSYPAYVPRPDLAGLNGIKLLQFKEDTSVSMNYSGTTVSQNQMVCYEIELVSLILPNQPLDNAIGGLIAFYPYVYVELSNVAAPSARNKNILYSNNPHAHNALFRAAITNTPTPVQSKFIKISGNGAVQTVKFKPNDYLHFRVTLSDGKTFQTAKEDSLPPVAPKPELQVSAQFGIRRLVN